MQRGREAPRPSSWLLRDAVFVYYYRIIYLCSAALGNASADRFPVRINSSISSIFAIFPLAPAAVQFTAAAAQLNCSVRASAHPRYIPYRNAP